MKKRVLSLLMAVLMLASLLPTAAMADGEPAAEENKAELVEKLEEPKEENLEEPKEEELPEAPMLLGAAPEGSPITQANFSSGAFSLSNGKYYLSADVNGQITRISPATTPHTRWSLLKRLAPPGRRAMFPRIWSWRKSRSARIRAPRRNIRPLPQL